MTWTDKPFKGGAHPDEGVDRLLDPLHLFLDIQSRKPLYQLLTLGSWASRLSPQVYNFDVFISFDLIESAIH